MLRSSLEPGLSNYLAPKLLCHNDVTAVNMTVKDSQLDVGCMGWRRFERATALQRRIVPVDGL